MNLRKSPEKEYLFIISSNKIIDIVTNGISQEIGRLTIGDLPWLKVNLKVNNPIDHGQSIDVQVIFDEN